MMMNSARAIATIAGAIFDCCPPPWIAQAMVAIALALFIIILNIG